MSEALHRFQLGEIASVGGGGGSGGASAGAAGAALSMRLPPQRQHVPEAEEWSRGILGDGAKVGYQSNQFIKNQLKKS